METSNYHIGPPIDKGGMATVYEGTHKTLGHKVAIKVLKKEYFYNDNIRKRFLAEARILAGMSHNNIIRVTDLIEEKESAAFVMEYIKGSNLRDYIEQKGKLPEDEIKYLFRQMLDAVGFVHEQGLIHRDIKPSNFMLDSQGNIKLLDFGIAKIQDPSAAEYTQTGTDVRMGTEMYMSPEQIVSTKTVTPQSDMYSLGVVLWEMVTGKKPYDIEILLSFDIQAKIVREPLELSNSRWDSIIQHLTKKDPDSRPRFILDVISEVSRINKNQNNYLKVTEQTTIDTAYKKETIEEKYTGNHDEDLLKRLKKIDFKSKLDIDKVVNLKNSGKLLEVTSNSPEKLFKEFQDTSDILFFSILSIVLMATIVDESPFKLDSEYSLYPVFGFFIIAPIWRFIIHTHSTKFDSFKNKNNSYVNSIIDFINNNF
jgi:serine/threonine protein kinase